MNNTFKQNCSVLQDSVNIAESISGSSEQDSIGEKKTEEVNLTFQRQPRKCTKYCGIFK